MGIGNLTENEYELFTKVMEVKYEVENIISYPVDYVGDGIACRFNIIEFINNLHHSAERFVPELINFLEDLLLMIEGVLYNGGFI